MAKQYAIQDQNRFPGLLGHSGTAGTADTIRLTATASGNANISLAEVGASIASTGVPITVSDTIMIDAFGRTRVSNTGQRFDIEFIYNKQPLLVDEHVTGAGTVTFNSNSRDLTLFHGGTALTNSAMMSSHYDIPYTAGNSQLIDVTGAINVGSAVGTAEIFFRNKVTGTVSETTYTQPNWNKNTATTVDWTKSQILQMDFQSLKVGRIRFNLVRNGLPVNIHQITNDNIRTGGYWQTPTLPVMWDIYNDANFTYTEMGYGDSDNAIGIRFKTALNATQTLRAICATVKSEGGKDLFDIPGSNKSIDNGVTAKTVSTTLIPLLSIKPSATFNSIVNRGLYIPTGWSAQTDNPIRVAVLYRATLTGANFVPVDATYSGMDYDVSATAVTGGILLDSDYIATGTKNTTAALGGLLGRTILSLGRNSIVDIITICAIRTSSSNGSVFSTFKWKEIR